MRRAYNGAMLAVWRRFSLVMQRVLALVLLVALARIVAGVLLIVLFQRDAIAWGPEVTLIVIGAVTVPVLVALAVRRWSPRRRVS